MKTVLAILLMMCVMLSIAVYVGTETGKVVQQQFDNINEIFEEAGVS